MQSGGPGEYEYTWSQPATWSPFNCNTQMGAIKVVTHEAAPPRQQGGVSTEDTILLLTILRETRLAESRTHRVGQDQCPLYCVDSLLIRRSRGFMRWQWT